MDVFTMVKYELFEETQTWEVCENGGFWSDQPYIEFDGRYKYPGVTLEHAAIVSGQEVRNYYIWNTYFSREGLTRRQRRRAFTSVGYLEMWLGRRTAGTDRRWRYCGKVKCGGAGYITCSGAGTLLASMTLFFNTAALPPVLYCLNPNLFSQQNKMVRKPASATSGCANARPGWWL